VRIAVEVRHGVLELSIRDDGCGGADPARGSGLIGLTDRVDSLGGTIEVTSPAGQGTTLRIRLPVEGS
jgi:signal transduction histidine kinase